MKQRKKELRKLIAQKKSEQSDFTLKEISRTILERLESHPAFRNAHTVVLYHSLKDEVYTHAFIEKWSTLKKIILPAVVGNELELRYYSPHHSLSTGAYGISEPTGEVVTNYADIDLIVIPGVAFSPAGARIGRGKGYYDKLLPNIAAYKIGICFPFQLVDDIPTEELDVAVDEVIA